MAQSDLGTISVNQKRLPYWKDTETIWYSQDTIMSRSISFQTVEYGIPWRWTLARDDTRLWKFSPPPEQPRLHPFHMLANLALFQGPSHLAGFINLRIMQDKIWPLEQEGLWDSRKWCQRNWSHLWKDSTKKSPFGPLPQEHLIAEEWFLVEKGDLPSSMGIFFVTVFPW